MPGLCQDGTPAEVRASAPYLLADGPGEESQSPQRWVLVFVAEAGSVPMSVRVKQIIKSALRRHGVRTVEVLNDVPGDVYPVELTEEIG